MLCDAKFLLFLIFLAIWLRFLASETGKTLSEDETRIRKEETELFAKLAESPKVIDSVNYLMENVDDKKSKASKNE